ncbi:hypothetical protein [Streptomyces sp. H27-C3]|uniref:hypothetical protein n=1 Tax=Streptomyces sp. H27-C3 TaxID=3046305 RepID=UPI0024BAAB44|nr:hypothetical protein [Streptomyces sp. H27-C3]MDJ0460648.1 hypothetical protein [Streptomyces sp. H27-C3]
MSTPTNRDPLAVKTRDGMVWVRAAVTRTGQGLYAPEAVGLCPQFVMATLPELAEHGIAGQGETLAQAVAWVGALPVPLGHGGMPPEDAVEVTALLEALVDTTHALTELRREYAVLEHQLGQAAEQRHLVDPLDHALEALPLSRTAPVVDEVQPQVAKLRTLLGREDVRPQVQQLRTLLARQTGAAPEVTP